MVLSLSGGGTSICERPRTHASRLMIFSEDIGKLTLFRNLKMPSDRRQGGWVGNPRRNVPSPGSHMVAKPWRVMQAFVCAILFFLKADSDLAKNPRGVTAMKGMSRTCPGTEVGSPSARVLKCLQSLPLPRDHVLVLRHSSARHYPHINPLKCSRTAVYKTPEIV